MKLIYNDIVVDIKMCTSFKARLMGLMFKKNKLNYCLCFPKCNSIHTFFMRQNIDVVMTNQDYKVMYVLKNMKPWKIILPKRGVYYTFEFNTNLINYKIGDIINIKKS